MSTVRKSNEGFKSATLRKIVLDMAFSAQCVHVGCAFSLIEILAVLHRDVLRYAGNDYDDPTRDYLVLSKGHGVMAQYACMHERGWISDDAIMNYFKNGSTLMGLCDARLPGLEVTSGSLGHGFSIGVGLALGARRRGTDQNVYCIIGDGEANEGAIWEGAMLAAQHRLDNFLTIVDANGLQAMGATSDIIDLGAIDAKFAAFGFETASIDGHDETAISDAIATLVGSRSGKPKAIIANTVKGKGVSFMEGDNIWHYSRLSAKQYEAAIDELKTDDNNA
jgi:transketolase